MAIKKPKQLFSKKEKQLFKKRKTEILEKISLLWDDYALAEERARIAERKIKGANLQ